MCVHFEKKSSANHKIFLNFKQLFLPCVRKKYNIVDVLLCFAVVCRYFFKMRSNEIELGGVVQQEITEDEDVLPLFDGKVIGKIEKQ